MFKKTMYTFLVNIIGSAILFLFQIFAAKYLGAEIYGESNYYLGFVNTVALFTFFGLQTNIIKNIQFEKDKNIYFSGIFYTLTIIYFLIIILGLVLCSNRIGSFNLVLILLLSYLTVLTEIIFSFYIGLGRSILASILKRFIVVSVQVIVFLIFIKYTNINYKTYLYVILISYLTVVIPQIVLRIKRCKPNIKVFSESLRFYLIQILSSLYLNLSKILQGSVGEFKSVAILSISLSIGNVTNLIGDSFAKVVMPEFSKAWRENNLQEIKSKYQYITRINSYLVLPIVIVGILNSHKILYFLGSDFSSGVRILQLVLFSQFINSFTGPNGTLLNMTNNETMEIMNGILKLATGLLIGISLKDHFVWGIAFSIAFSELIVNLLKTIQVKKICGFFPYDKETVTYILLILILEMALFIPASKISNIYIWALLNCIIIVISYLLTIFFSKNIQDKEILTAIKMRLFKIKK